MLSDEIVKITLIVTILFGCGLFALLKLMDSNGVISFNVDIMSFYLLIWSLILSVIISLLIIYSNTSTYVCDPYGSLVKLPCDRNEKDCFTSKQSCPQETGYLIRSKDTNLYLTLEDQNKLHLKDLGTDDDYLRQIWLMYRADGSPFYFSSIMTNIEQSIIKSLWNKTMCISTTNELVDCSEKNTLNNIMYGPYKNGEGMCLKHLDGFVLRDVCMNEDELNQSWEFIAV